jgi:hypothetical protein
VRKVFMDLAMAGMVLVAGPGLASGKPVAARSESMLVRMSAGAQANRVELSEPAGVIRLLRVVVPAGTRVKVTGAIPRLAGVSIAIPSARHDNAETCVQDGRSVVCTQAEEACPMPAATWHFLVRKVAGPAGRIRIEFVVRPEHSV